MEEKKYYAHTKTKPDGTPAPQSAWQPLDEHLKNVADIAAGFAKSFDSSDWAYDAGLLHDLGKASLEFQKYLEESAKQYDLDLELPGMTRVIHSSQRRDNSHPMVAPRTGAWIETEYYIRLHTPY